MHHGVGALAGNDSASGGRTWKNSAPRGHKNALRSTRNRGQRAGTGRPLPTGSPAPGPQKSGGAPQCFGAPVAKLRGFRADEAFASARGRVDDPGRGGLSRQNRNGFWTTDLRSVGARAGIVLPSVVSSPSLRPAFSRDRECLALAASRGRHIGGTLDAFLARHLSLLHRRRKHPR